MQEVGTDPANRRADALFVRNAPVDVLVAHDVAFIVGAGLHLDEKGWDLSGISEPVPFANGNVCRLRRLQVYLGRLVANLGVAGYGPLQELIVLRKHAQK